MTSLGFVWKNLNRKMVRTTLTSFCLFVAFLLYVALGSIAVVFEVDTYTDESGANRLVTTPKYSMIDSIPKKYLDEIAALENVEMATQVSWFGGYYREASNDLITFVVDPDTYFDVYSEFEISDEHLSAFIENRRGMLIPDFMFAEFGEQYGWQLGDVIPIGSQIYPQQDGNPIWEMELVGTYTPPNSGMGAVLFGDDYFDDATMFGAGTVHSITMKITDPSLGPELSQTIDAMYVNSMDPTRTATESEQSRQFLAQYGNISLMMSGILLAVFFTILLLCANTMSQAFRERIPELAVLKTLGFSDSKLSMFILGESVLLCFTPAVVGVITGFGALALLATSGGAGMFFPPIPVTIALQVSASAMALAVGLGLLVGLLPAVTASRLSIVEAMRS